MDVARKNKVLIISRSFPPENISAVHRPLNFVKYLPQFGWEPHVVTTQKNTCLLDHSLLIQIKSNIRINEVFSFDPDNLKRLFKSNGSNGKSTGKHQYLSHLVLRALLKLYNIIYCRTIIIDYYDGWIPCGFLKGKQIIKKDGVDLIYVHGQPPCSFVIGLLLKKITGKPLVIDYDDSWTTSFYEKNKKGLKKIIRRSIEAKLLETADKVISVKKTTIEELLKEFSGIKKSKFNLITNGYDPNDFVGLNLNKGSKFVITYTGTISDKYYYSPESFLKAVGELVAEQKILKEHLEIKFIGLLISRYKERFLKLIHDLDLNDVIQIIGQRNHRECIEYQYNADLLLYIIESPDGRDISYQFAGVLPAKIFEYIYSGVPILGIVPPGFEADLLKKTGTGFIAEPNDVNSIKKAVLDIFKMYKNGTLSITPNTSEIKKYDRKHLTRDLAKVFDDLMVTVSKSS
jgi:glycosyltransferase involved in cell wall biosynthesis